MEDYSIITFGLRRHCAMSDDCERISNILFIWFCCRKNLKNIDERYQINCKSIKINISNVLSSLFVANVYRKKRSFDFSQSSVNSSSDLSSNTLKQNKNKVRYTQFYFRIKLQESHDIYKDSTLEGQHFTPCSASPRPTHSGLLLYSLVSINQTKPQADACNDTEVRYFEALSLRVENPRASEINRCGGGKSNLIQLCRCSSNRLQVTEK